jgi:hypothetical protein
MASFVTYNDFKEQLGLKQHDLNADPIYVELTNEAPVLTDTTRADYTGLSTTGGYTAGGSDTLNTFSESPAGTGALVGTDIVWTGSGGGFGPFRYAVLYNQVGGLGAGNKLIGYWDYGSSISVGAGETFTVDFGSTIGTITGT